jgi:cytochrome c biogenesis protein CcmG/thiol:disulfide interchange protein DsbE
MPFVPPRCRARAAPRYNANVMNLAPLLLVAALALPAHAASPGESAPPLALSTAGGERVSLESLRGKLVYVDFWASWCSPCKRSFPWMAEMQRRYGERGFVVLAVNVDKQRADAERFLKGTPAAFTVVFDDSGQTPQAWQVKGMPSSYLVDPSGKVLLAESGFRDERKDEVEARIRAALPAR